MFLGIGNRKIYNRIGNRKIFNQHPGSLRLDEHNSEPDEEEPPTPLPTRAAMSDKTFNIISSNMLRFQLACFDLANVSATILPLCDLKNKIVCKYSL